MVSIFYLNTFLRTTSDTVSAKGNHSIQNVLLIVLDFQKKKDFSISRKSCCSSWCHPHFPSHQLSSPHLPFSFMWFNHAEWPTITTDHLCNIPGMVGALTWSSHFISSETFTRKLWFYSFTEHQTHCCRYLSGRLDTFDAASAHHRALLSSSEWCSTPSLSILSLSNPAIFSVSHRASQPRRCWGGRGQLCRISLTKPTVLWRGEGCVLRDLLHDLELPLLLTLILTLAFTPLITLLHTFRDSFTALSFSLLWVLETTKPTNIQ